MTDELPIAELFPEIDQIEDDELRRKTVAVWQDLWEQSDWSDIHEVPVAPDIPTPHVPHNQSVMQMALAVADALESHHGVEIDRDLLISGGLLQDASKLVEYRLSPEGEIEVTDIGREYPHGFWGAKVATEHGVPDPICNIILNHTPASSSFPNSLEGKILYHVDQIDVVALVPDRWKKKLYVYR